MNSVGAVMFLTVSAKTAWVEPELRNTSGAAGGGALLWGLVAFPIAAAFLLLNSAMAGYALIHLTKRSPRLPIVTWLSIPIWLMALTVDYIHHGT
jgi:hypothetical protein